MVHGREMAAGTNGWEIRRSWIRIAEELALSSRPSHNTLVFVRARKMGVVMELPLVLRPGHGNIL
jgi:hypothetical protein